MMQSDGFKEFFSSIFSLVIFLIILLIAYLKRRKTVGKRWGAPLAAELKIRDVSLICHHCQGNLFHKREAIIATTLVSIFFNIFWNRSGVAYECKQCGYLHWFNTPQETVISFHRDSSLPPDSF